MMFSVFFARRRAERGKEIEENCAVNGSVLFVGKIVLSDVELWIVSYRVLRLEYFDSSRRVISLVLDVPRSRHVVGSISHHGVVYVEEIA